MSTATTAPSPAAAAVQRVLDGTWSAELDSAGAAIAVEARYRLTPDTAVDIPFLLVRFGNPRVHGLRATLEGRPLAAEALEAPERVRRGRFPLPPGHGDTVELVLRYRVSGLSAPDEGDFDLPIPVALVDWRPAAAREGFFSGRVRLPDDYTPVDVFPTVPWERRVHADGRGSELAFSLPVPPSLVRIRGRTGPSPLLTVGRWVDVGVGALLVLLGIVAWRELRRAT